MANVKKGNLTPPPQWWKHLDWCKRVFWKQERQAQEKRIVAETHDALEDRVYDAAMPVVNEFGDTVWPSDQLKAKGTD